MWQRIQTLYLAISTGLLASLFFSDIATAIGNDGQSAAIAFTDKLTYLIMLTVSAISTAAALVTFKKRSFQVRAAVFGALILLAFQIWLVVDYFSAGDGMIFKLTAVFPAICCILDILAARAIYGDELMVRNASRLRAAKRRK